MGVDYEFLFNLAALIFLPVIGALGVWLFKLDDRVYKLREDVTRIEDDK